MSARSRHWGAAAGRRPALIASLLSAQIVGGLLTASAGTALPTAGFAFLGLLPLLFGIRLLGPGWAAVCGAVWGASCQAALSAWGVGESRVGFATVVLLTVVPALYASLCSLATRRFGFHPYLLSLGWLLAEWALSLLPSERSLLTMPVGFVLQDVIARGLGYAFVGFVLAFVNAVLVQVVIRIAANPGTFVVRLKIAKLVRESLCQFTDFALRRFFAEPLRPRAPPGPE